MTKRTAVVLAALSLATPAGAVDLERLGTVAIAKAQLTLFKERCLGQVPPVAIAPDLERALESDAASYRGTSAESEFDDAYAYFLRGYAPLAERDPARFCGSAPLLFQTWGYAGIVKG